MQLLALEPFLNIFQHLSVKISSSCRLDKVYLQVIVCVCCHVVFSLLILFLLHGSSVGDNDEMSKELFPSARKKLHFSPHSRSPGDELSFS